MSVLDSIIRYKILEKQQAQANAGAISSALKAFLQAQQSKAILDLERRKIDLMAEEIKAGKEKLERERDKKNIIQALLDKRNLVLKKVSLGGMTFEVPGQETAQPIVDRTGNVIGYRPKGSVFAPKEKQFSIGSGVLEEIRKSIKETYPWTVADILPWKTSPRERAMEKLNRKVLEKSGIAEENDKDYDVNLTNAVEAVKRGKSPDAVYRKMLRFYPHKKAELRRILLGG